MKDQYACDVGDFAKFGLLRTLAGVSPHANPLLRVGIVWYLTPDSGNNDGCHRSYLDALRAENARRFRTCDPSLYDALRTVLGAGRSVAALEAAKMLPESTRYQLACVVRRDNPRHEALGWFRAKRSTRPSWQRTHVRCCASQSTPHRRNRCPPV